MIAATKILKIQPIKRSKTGRVYEKPIYKPHAADPIKDPNVVKALRESLLKNGRHGKRNVAIFELGLVSGRRCGDILNLQIGEVWDDIAGCVKDKIIYYDKKTRRWLPFFLRSTSKALLHEYLEDIGAIKNNMRVWPITAYIFQSQKGKTLSVRSYTDILKKAQLDCGIIGIEHLSSHSMRKTFGRNAYLQTGSAEFVTQALGHYDFTNTSRYIGLDDEWQRETYNRIHTPGLD